MSASETEGKFSKPPKLPNETVFVSWAMFYKADVTSVRIVRSRDWLQLYVDGLLVAQVEGNALNISYELE